MKPRTRGILRTSRRNGLDKLESKGGDGNGGTERDRGRGEADGHSSVAATKDTGVRSTDSGRTATGRGSSRGSGGRGGGVNNKASSRTGLNMLHEMILKQPELT